MTTKTEFAIAEVMPGKLNALVKNIMTQTGAKDPNEAVRLVNSGEWVVQKYVHSWREEDGVIYFSVKSDPVIDENWIKRLEGNGFRVEGYAKQVLFSQDFKPTNGVITEVAVLRGNLFEDNDRNTKKIRSFAEAFRTPDGRKLLKPNAELACLIREKFTDREIGAMGLRYIVTMHKSINDAEGNPCLLVVNRGCDGRWLDVCPDMPGHIWDRDGGFAYEVSRSSSQR